MYCKVGLIEPALGRQFQSPRREHPCRQALRGISSAARARASRHGMRRGRGSRRQYTSNSDLRRIGSPSPDRNSSLRYRRHLLLRHFRLHIRRPMLMRCAKRRGTATVEFGYSPRTGSSLLGFRFRGLN
ncbi:hypothetical protein EUGRSUZ_F00683 [Eucalyptus grandis]|uniref:Uncharacterized protein n=2 Tax=Eucalyptus grandis TaxID=71139 RepID=A0ACC3KCH9_EUCGR|nr:hypothetical protein EUGRSUZ_F00683 [Eucalyptus grandis]